MAHLCTDKSTASCLIRVSRKSLSGQNNCKNQAFFFFFQIFYGLQSMNILLLINHFVEHCWNHKYKHEIAKLWGGVTFSILGFVMMQNLKHLQTICFPTYSQKMKNDSVFSKDYWDTNHKLKSTVERIHTYIMGLKSSSAVT